MSMQKHLFPQILRQNDSPCYICIGYVRARACVRWLALLWPQFPDRSSLSPPLSAMCPSPRSLRQIAW